MGVRRGSSTSSTAFQDADDEGGRGLTHVADDGHRSSQVPALENPQFHRRKVLRLVDHDVAVGDKLGLVQFGTWLSAPDAAPSRSAAARTSPAYESRSMPSRIPDSASLTTGRGRRSGPRSTPGPRRSVLRRLWSTSRRRTLPNAVRYKSSSSSSLKNPCPAARSRAGAPRGRGAVPVPTVGGQIRSRTYLNCDVNE